MSVHDTQCEVVLRHLKSGRSLSQTEATIQYGITNLSQRVLELRALGHPIACNWVKSDASGRSPSGRRYGRYEYDFSAKVAATQPAVAPASLPPSHLIPTAAGASVQTPLFMPAETGGTLERY